MRPRLRREGILTIIPLQLLYPHQYPGSCADGYKLAAALVHEGRGQFKGNPALVNMVHDELVLEVDEGDAQHDAALLEEIMLEGTRRAVGDAPISVDVLIARHWGDKG